MQFYEVIFSQSEIKTVQDYILEPNCPVALPKTLTSDDRTSRGRLYKICKEFLSWTSDGLTTNEDRIRSTYTSLEARDNENISPLLLQLKPGVKFVIPFNKVNREGLLTEGFQLTYTSEKTFKAFELAKLEADTGYVQVTSPLPSSVQSGSIKEYLPDVTIWIWCRALSPKNPIPQDTSPFLGKMEGEMFDLSPFIEKCSTSTTKTGGNFQISLPPLVCEFNDSNGWVIKKDSLKRTISKINGKQEYLSDNSVFNLNTQENKLERNEFLFHNIISTNDLVFIRFETLEMEADVRYKDKQNFYLNKNNIAGRIYDMIGLVDNNSKIYSPQNNSISIQISGRDLSKLFIEDGVYYYPLENSQGVVNVGNGGSSAKDPLTRRILFNGDLTQSFLNLYSFAPIDRVIEFLIQQLSNIGVVPNSLFLSYGDRRNQRLSSSESKNNLLKGQRILDSYVSSSKEELSRLRNLYNLTVTISGSPDKLGEQIESNLVYLKLKEFLSTIRIQNLGYVPRIVNNNTTVGWSAFSFEGEQLQKNQFPSFFQDQIYPSTSTPLFFVAEGDLQTLVSLIDREIDGRNNQNYQSSSTMELATGIWQIIDLVFDEVIATRRIVDSSLSSAGGSLLNYIKKVCLEPFVEYYMDTYSDRFCLIVRRPPHNKEGIQSLLQGKVRNEKTGEELNAPVIEIEELDVLQETLSYDDTGVYSWYKLTPQNLFAGNNVAYSTATLPALYFPEYAEIWGSKAMDAMHNYSPYLALDSNKNKGVDPSLKQAYIDLAYLVESNAYLPFTRKGTIVINGDRRVKIGNLIRYLPTGEVFLVDGVSQSYSISEGAVDRTTTIQVSRGMVEKLIEGVSIVGENNTVKVASYFNIINTSLDFTKTKTIKTTKTVQVRNPLFTPTNPFDESTSQNLNSNSVTSSSFVNTSQQLGTLSNTSLSPFQIGVKSVTSKLDTGKLSPDIEDTLSKLNPTAAKIFRNFILKVQKLGYKVLTTDGLRSYQKQINEFKKNPKRYKIGTDLSKAPHVQGTAIDLNLVQISTGRQFYSSTSKFDWELTGVPGLAKSLNLKWGGDFSKTDTVHFQLEGKGQSNTIDDNGQPEFIEQDVPGQDMEFPDQDKILENFKVDRDIFSFFLRKEQQKYRNG